MIDVKDSRDIHSDRVKNINFLIITSKQQKEKEVDTKILRDNETTKFQNKWK